MNFIYSQEEALELLKNYSAEMTSRTLQNYINDELMPMPIRKNLGRAGGVVTSYTKEDISQAYASWKLLNGVAAKVTSLKVREIRQIALYILEKGFSSGKEMLDDSVLKEKLDKKPLEVYLVVEWLKARAKVFYRYLTVVIQENYKAWENRNKAVIDGNKNLEESYNALMLDLNKEKGIIEFFSEDDTTSYHISGLYGFVVKKITIDTQRHP